jgi:hypothetical protein
MVGRLRSKIQGMGIVADGKYHLLNFSHGRGPDLFGFSSSFTDITVLGRRREKTQ